MLKHRKVWEEVYGKIPDGFEIHHVDGNNKNNDISNLKMVSIREHLSIHKSQGDWGAVQAILMRLNRSEEDVILIRECASKYQIQLLESGCHNFQKLDKKERSEISKQVGEMTRDKKIGIHAINADPELSKLNSSNAGKTSYKKSAGFHSADKTKWGSTYVKNTKWWTNKLTGKRKRCHDCPGEDWIEGMIKEKV